MQYWSAVINTAEVVVKLQNYPIFRIATITLITARLKINVDDGQYLLTEYKFPLAVKNSPVCKYLARSYIGTQCRSYMRPWYYSSVTRQTKPPHLESLSMSRTVYTRQLLKK